MVSSNLSDGQTELKTLFFVILSATLLGCNQSETQSDDSANVTVDIRVMSYDSDAAHNTVAGPDGEQYHADMYDAAYCKVTSSVAGLPNPLVIWGWSRTEYVPESLHVPDATAKISFKRSAIDDAPAGGRGVAATEITVLD